MDAEDVVAAESRGNASKRTRRESGVFYSQGRDRTRIGSRRGNCFQALFTKGARCVSENIAEFASSSTTRKAGHWLRCLVGGGRQLGMIRLTPASTGKSNHRLDPGPLAHPSFSHYPKAAAPTPYPFSLSTLYCQLRTDRGVSTQVEKGNCQPP